MRIHIQKGENGGGGVSQRELSKKCFFQLSTLSQKTVLDDVASGQTTFAEDHICRLGRQIQMDHFRFRRAQFFVEVSQWSQQLALFILVVHFLKSCGKAFADQLKILNHTNGRRRMLFLTYKVMTCQWRQKLSPILSETYQWFDACVGMRNPFLSLVTLFVAVLAAIDYVYQCIVIWRSMPKQTGKDKTCIVLQIVKLSMRDIPSIAINLLVLILLLVGCEFLVLVEFS